MLPGGNWLRLVWFCLMRVLGLSLVLAMILVGGALELAHGQTAKVPHRNIRDEQPAASQGFSGVITDSGCGARHAAKAGLSSAECARFCVRNGASYVLVDGDKRYALDGHHSELGKLAGQRVRISGTRNGDTIVESVLGQ